MRSVSGSGTDRHRGLSNGRDLYWAGRDTNRPRSAQTGNDRHRPALAGLDRHKTGTDRSGLFFDVFDTHFVLNGPKRYDVLKILIKYVIKYKMSINYVIKSINYGPGRSVPICAGRYRCLMVPVPVLVVPGSDLCSPVPVPLTDRK